MGKGYYEIKDRESFSSMSEFIKNPYALGVFKDGEKVETDSMKKGTLIHEALLEDNVRSDIYKLRPIGSNGKSIRAGTKAHDEFLATLKKGQKEITIENHKMLIRIEAALEQNKASTYLRRLDRVGHEMPILWTNQGVPFKSKIDLLCVSPKEKKLYLIDYKTTRDAKPEKFRYSITNYSYHVQMYWYKLALKDLIEGKADKEQLCDYKGLGKYKGWEIDNVIIAIETSDPYLNVVYRMSDGISSIMTSAKERADEWINTYKDERSGNSSKDPSRFIYNMESFVEV